MSHGSFRAKSNFHIQGSSMFSDNNEEYEEEEEEIVDDHHINNSPSFGNGIRNNQNIKNVSAEEEAEEDEEEEEEEVDDTNTYQQGTPANKEMNMYEQMQPQFGKHIIKEEDENDFLMKEEAKIKNKKQYEAKIKNKKQYEAIDNVDDDDDNDIDDDTDKIIEEDTKHREESLRLNMNKRQKQLKYSLNNNNNNNHINKYIQRKQNESEEEEEENEEEEEEENEEEEEEEEDNLNNNNNSNSNVGSNSNTQKHLFSAFKVNDTQQTSFNNTSGGVTSITNITKNTNSNYHSGDAEEEEEEEEEENEEEEEEEENEKNNNNNNNNDNDDDEDDDDDDNEINNKYNNLNTINNNNNNENSLSNRVRVSLRAKTPTNQSSSSIQNNYYESLNKQIQKPEFNIDEETFDNLTKDTQSITADNLPQMFNHVLHYNNNNEFPFAPQINEHSRRIVAKKEREALKKSTSPHTVRGKIPAHFALYSDALKRKAKQERIDANTMSDIKLKANKTKLNNKSHSLALSRNEKRIDDVTQRISKNGMLDFFSIGKVLYDLQIFRELLKRRDVDGDEEIQNINELKYEISRARNRKKEERKLFESEFLDQLWIKLNPKQFPVIKTERFADFLKILSSPVDSTVKEISTISSKFLQAALFLDTNQYSPYQLSSSHKDNGVVFQLSDNCKSKQDIWSMSTLVSNFQKLNKNVIAYKKKGTVSRGIQERIEEEQRELTFKPKISKTTKAQPKDIYERIQGFMEHKDKREKTLDKLRKIKEQEEKKLHPFQPQITEKKNIHGKRVVQNVFDHNYEVGKRKQEEKRNRMEQRRREIENEEDEKCTFHPQIEKKDLKEVFEIAKSPTNISKNESKAFNNHVIKIRRGTFERLKKDYLLNQRPTGENYDKLQRTKHLIKPPNITDIKLGRKKWIQEKAKKNKDLNDEYRSVSFEKEKDEEEDNVVEMQLTLPGNKRKVSVKIYKHSDPWEIAESVGKTHSLNKCVTELLYNQIEYLQKTNFNNEDNDNEEEEEEEDGEGQSQGYDID